MGIRLWAQRGILWDNEGTVNKGARRESDLAISSKKRRVRAIHASEFLFWGSNLGFYNICSLIHPLSAPGTKWTLLWARHWPKCENPYCVCLCFPICVSPLLPATAKQQNPSLGSVGSLVLLLVKTDEGSYSKNINPRYPGVFSHTSQIIPLFTLYFRGLVPVSLPLLSQLKVLQG